jgi:hypothetical protein
MKKLFTWLIIRAFRVQEFQSSETKEISRLKAVRRHNRTRNAAIILTTIGIVLLLIPFFNPELINHFKLSNVYNTASIMNTCSGCFISVSTLLIIDLVENHKNVFRENLKSP